MTICYVFQKYPSDGSFSDSGISTYLQHLISQVSKEHHVVVVTTGSRPGVVRKGNISIHVLPERPLSPIASRTANYFVHILQVAIALMSIHALTPLNIIEFANWEAEGLAFVLSVNKLLHIPYVIHLFTDSAIIGKVAEDPHTYTKIISTCEKIFVRTTHHLVTHTREHAEISAKLYGIPEDNIAIIPLGLPLPPRTPYPQKEAYSFGIDPQAVTILYVGRMEKRKGIDVLLQAIPLVLKKHDNTYFYLIGSDCLDIHRLILDTLSFREMIHVRYLGSLGTPAVTTFYKAATLCVFPSIYESFCFTAAEAMSYGNAVITSDVGGIPELVTNGTDGILVEPGSPKKLARAITLLISDNLKRSMLKRNARRTIGSKYRIKIMADRTIAYYRTLLT